MASDHLLFLALHVHIIIVCVCVCVCVCVPAVQPIGSTSYIGMDRKKKGGQ